MRTWIMAASAAALLLAPSAGFAQGGLDQLVAAAKKESELNFMASGGTFGGQEAINQLEAAFNKKFGLNMKLRFTPGPSMVAMAARLLQEYKAGAKATTDVFIGPLSSFALLGKEGALTDVRWADTFPWVTPEMEISKGHGVLIRTSISAIIYNPTLLKPADAPKSNEDLVDPVKSKAWAGKMAMPPYPDWLVELSLILPKDKVIDFTRKLVSLASGYIRYDEGERLVNGEFVLMANDADGPSGKAFWTAKGAPLEFVVGSDPAEVYYFQLGVPKNASSPNLATLFAAFVASPEGQEVINRIGFQGSHLVPNTSVAKYLASTKINLMSAQRLLEFYRQGGAPDLAAEINQIMKR